jgi:DNA-binding SARP family transcriptional activator
MPLSEMVIKSKLIPPQSQKAVLHRQRLHERLVAASKYPLTIIHAGTGFGKTTALVELGSLYAHVYWYNITEPDRDPTLFLAHLISVFLPTTAPLLERLEKGGGVVNTGIFNSLINQLTTDLEEDAVLILDDFHLVNNVPDINRWFELLVEQQPPHLRIAFASRQIPETPAFIRWRVKGNLLLIDQSDLSFSQNEIINLFTDNYHFPITNDQALALYSYTDGWIIALQMIWQRIQSSQSKNLDNIIAELPTALSEIFNFLAQEVLLRQPKPIQQFLVSTAVLHEMDADCCNYLLKIDNSQEILHVLNDKGLFISTADDMHFRYQRLFQDFLLDQAAKAPEISVQDLHKKAADYFTATKNFEEAVFHRFNGGDLVEAANLIELISPQLLEIGRLRTIAKWVKQLDNVQLDLHPSLEILMGDVLRLQSKFEEAIAFYDKAEKVFVKNKDPLGRSQALRSKAQVYLDTVRPLRASSLLEEAVGLLEPQEYPSDVAALLDQLAENKLNLGKPVEAQELHKEASMLRSESDPDAIYLEARALLRTGKLQEGRNLLESYATVNENLSTQRPQRFHREMPLLLSLICLMLGDIQKGESFARQGIEIGRQLDAPFVEAVGLMRLGHAYQLYPHVPWRKHRLEKAREFYEKAIELVKPFNVMRVQVEPLWGLCRYYGYQGNINEAKRYANQAIEIAEASGDSWFAALLTVTMGTSYVLAGEKDTAENWLKRGIKIFSDVGDTFGQAAGACALLLNYWTHDEKQKALTDFADLAKNLKLLNLDFLLTQSNFLGIQEDQVFYPLLLDAYNQGIEKNWIGSILKKKHLDGVDFHPGYGLAIHSLGPFEVWRDSTTINNRDWQREKARQLFQYLINGRGKWFTKDQICDKLWPELEGDPAQNFKVALNALNKAIEPNRESGKSPFFITRRENTYSLNSAAKIMLDIDDFLKLCVSNNEEDLKEALSIYQGDYFCEISDDHWADDQRERLRDAYLTSALRLGEIYFHSSRWDDAIILSHEILTVDVCNEHSYRLLMQCHAERGNRATVQAVYQRCCTVLREELDVGPSIETVRLWKTLSK